MKKLLSLLLAVIVVIGCVSFASCGEKEAKTDFETIKEKGELVIGITEFKPLNYKENGEWTGFETEFAQYVCEQLGVTPKFQVIDWDSKVTELKSGNIDVIWNGMTVTDKLAENMDFSTTYIKNYQVVVVKEDAKYKSTADLASLKLTCEKGSAGETAIKEDANLSKATCTPVTKQADALLEVKSGSSNAAVIDYVMAKKSVGDGTDYSDLKIIDGIELSSEEYGIGIRKGSDLKAKIDDQIKAMSENGKLNEIAAKYDLKDSLIINQ